MAGKEYKEKNKKKGNVKRTGMKLKMRSVEWNEIEELYMKC